MSFWFTIRSILGVAKFSATNFLGDHHIRLYYPQTLYRGKCNEKQKYRIVVNIISIYENNKHEKLIKQITTRSVLQRDSESVRVAT